jgi:hypothetical protein
MKNLKIFLLDLDGKNGGDKIINVYGILHIENGIYYDIDKTGFRNILLTHLITGLVYDYRYQQKWLAFRILWSK